MIGVRAGASGPLLSFTNAAAASASPTSPLAGSFSVPAGAQGFWIVRGCGSGGSGGGGSNTGVAGGGAGGASPVWHWFFVPASPGVYSVFVAGAALGGAVNTAGNLGIESYIADSLGVVVWRSGSGYGGSPGAGTSGGAGGACTIYSQWLRTGASSPGTGSGTGPAAQPTTIPELELVSGASGAGSVGTVGGTSPNHSCLRCYNAAQSGAGAGASGAVTSMNEADNGGVSATYRMQGGAAGNPGDNAVANNYGAGGPGGGQNAAGGDGGAGKVMVMVE